MITYSRLALSENLQRQEIANNDQKQTQNNTYYILRLINWAIELTRTYAFLFHRKYILNLTLGEGQGWNLRFRKSTNVKTLFIYFVFFNRFISEALGAPTAINSIELYNSLRHFIHTCLVSKWWVFAIVRLKTKPFLNI